ncbi:unnamed protein product [Allacma fusca]|uniref:Peptidase S1 domain-containing protein n=1 Tax=Allacma fusca TaxID=39272 RepID=A0A8J2LPY3_9HEXA|nr:unnamed protein product [Allacma fusca]
MITNSVTIVLAIGLTLVLGHPANDEKNLGVDIIGKPETKPFQLHSIVHVMSISANNSIQHTCGGTIINANFVLTAAHCLTGTSYWIVAGDTEIVGAVQPRQALFIILHQKYNKDTYENDIGLIQVDPPFKMNQHVQPAILAPADYVIHENATAIGWEKLNPDGTAHDPLKHATMDIVSEESCRQAYGKDLIFVSVMCAGHPKGGSGVYCEGNAGNPLVQNGQVVGITSRAHSCTRPQYPGVYTEMSFFSNWVKLAIS